MNLAGSTSTLGTRARLGISLIALAGAALLAGCRGNTTAAANVDHHAGKPPEIIAARAPQNMLDADPLLAPAWRDAQWHLLVAPANSTRMPPPTRTAVLYDAGTLYVAAICQTSPSEESHDAIALYLDPRGEGRELLQITASAAGTSQCTWIRSDKSIAPQDDGSPNKSYPLDLRPDFKLAGLATHIWPASIDARGEWSLTMAVPVASLPALMQSAPASGHAWKFNILRTLTADPAISSGQQEQLQSNLSPVYINAQAFSPYRMASLDFAAN